jgi:4-amino-4-deoxy-L-arabinose transferase-like glycosyltransferase
MNAIPQETIHPQAIASKLSTKKPLLVITLICTVYVIFAVGHAMTQRPWSDEAWFANASYNLATTGEMGTTVFGTREGLPGIEKRTYWVMPLYLVLEAFWYKVFGFSLFTHRYLTVFFGLIGMISWFFIMKSLSGKRAVGVLAMGLVALDYY